MTLFMEKQRPEACLSDFALDSVRLGELAAGEARKAEEHLRGCTDCAGRLEAFRAEAAAFDVPLSKVGPVVPLVASETGRVLPWRPKTKRAVFSAVGSALAVAAAVVLFLRAGAVPTNDATSDAVQTKGPASHVGFFVEHQGRVRRGFEGDVVHPTDKLQFTVSMREAAYVAVVSIDGAKSQNVYFASNTRLGPTKSAEELSLPSSVLLDDVLGEETIWGLVCKERQDEVELRAALARSGTSFVAPKGCNESKWTVTKAAGGK